MIEQHIIFGLQVFLIVLAIVALGEYVFRRYLDAGRRRNRRRDLLNYVSKDCPAPWVRSEPPDLINCRCAMPTIPIPNPFGSKREGDILYPGDANPEIREGVLAWFRMRRDQAVRDEDYETAAKMRDLLKTAAEQYAREGAEEHDG